MQADAKGVERYLHSRIPITRAMGVEVVTLDDAGVRLAAPLNENINHRSSIFGGSASAVAILSAWTLLFVRLRGRPVPSQIVIQRNSVEYLRPMLGDFEAFCTAPTAEVWDRFLNGLTRRGRARITLHAELFCTGELAGTFQGVYVASRLDASDH